RSRVGTGSPVPLTTALIDQPLVGPAFRKVLIQPDRGVEIRKGIFLVAERQIRQPTRVISVRLARRVRDRFGEIFNGELMLVAGLVEETAPVIGARVGRIQVDRTLKVLERFVGPSAQPVELAASDI